MNYDNRMRHTVKADTSVTERLHQAQQARHALDLAEVLRTAGATSDLLATTSDDLIGKAAAALGQPTPSERVRELTIKAMVAAERSDDPFDGLA